MERMEFLRFGGKPNDKDRSLLYTSLVDIIQRVCDTPYVHVSATQ